MNTAEVIRQLEALRTFCDCMEIAEDADENWETDVDALTIAIDILREREELDNE